MATREEAQGLLGKGEYPAAARLLDRLLAKDRDDDQLWYLRGIASFRMKNYEAAEEALEHALALRPRTEYWRMKGYVHMEACEFPHAIASFQRALEMDKGNATTWTLMAFCYLLLNDPRSQECIRRAYTLDAKKTKEWIQRFYEMFLKNHPEVTEPLRNRLETRIRSIVG